jgi:ABC-type transport system involved in Fe-S cluster assembly fused permease/ATPase subunit
MVPMLWLIATSYRTTVVIAHRFAAVMAAGEILVPDEWAVDQRGPMEFMPV